MLDLKFIRENPDAVRAACVKKRIEVDLDRLLALDRDLRELRREQEALRTEQNAKSKEIPKLAPAERAVALEATKELSNRLKEFDAKVKVLCEEIEHHVKEEEKPKEGLFAQCRDTDVDLVELRDRMLARKQELMAQAEAGALPPAEVTAVNLSPA